MKNTTMLALMIIVIVAIGAFVYANSNISSNNYSDANNSETAGELQKVTLGLKNYNYYPNTITVKVNQKVELTLDSSVSGCLRAFTIKDLGVYKTSKNPSDKIIFTPTKKGTFRFACTMGMGFGTIIVE